MELLTILFLVLAVGLAAFFGYLVGKAVMKARLREDADALRQDAIKRSRAVLTGQISEQLAPFLPDFPWNSAEARFIGKPIDFLIFQGMDGKEISEVIFVEVKTGGSRLSAVERSLKAAIEGRRVRWAEYRPKS